MPAVRCLFVLTGLLLALPVAQAVPESLRLCHAADESFHGLLNRTPGVSKTMAMEVAAALKLELRPMATAACLEAIQQGRMEGAISLAFVNEPAVFLVYPGMKGGRPDADLRMYNNSFSLFHRKQDKLGWDGRKLEVSGAVGVRRGSAVALRLRELGAKVDASSDTYLDRKTTPARWSKVPSCGSVSRRPYHDRVRFSDFTLHNTLAQRNGITTNFE